MHESFFFLLLFCRRFFSFSQSTASYFYKAIDTDKANHGNNAHSFNVLQSCWGNIWIMSTEALGFPGGSDGKESTCNAGDLGSIPGLGRSPGGGHGNPLQYSCLENPMDRAAWWALQSMGLQRVRHDWTTNHMKALARYFSCKPFLTSIVDHPGKTSRLANI